MTNATTHEHDLEDHIPTLRKLDEARRRSAELRDAGIEVLMECLYPLRESEKLSVSKEWRRENSLVIRALLTRHDQPLDKPGEEGKRLELIESLIDRLQDDGLTLEKLEKEELSVLVAANVLRTLTAQPGAGFFKTAMLCHYWIIRELYTADGSDWSVGGARAAPGGFVTAFTTGECARALLSFADTLRNTGKFVADVDEYLTRMEQLKKLGDDHLSGGLPLEKWAEAEEERLRLSYSLKLKRLSRYLVLSLKPNKANSNIDMGDHLKEITRKEFDVWLKQETGRVAGEFQWALIHIGEYRNNEKDKNGNAILRDTSSYLYEEPFHALSTLSVSQKQQLNNVTRSDSAHMVAVLAVKYGLDQVKEACELFADGKDIDHPYREIKRRFDEAADGVHKLLHPVRSYLSSVLDRELVLVSLGESLDWRPGELACAAASYGRLTGKWEKDVRFGRAVSDLSKMVSSRGRFANPHHIHEQRDGVRYMMGNAVTLHAMAQLLGHACDSEIETGLAENVLRFFEDTRAKQAYVTDAGKQDSSDKRGWSREFSQPPLKTELKATASAVMALAEINKMLDARINHIILEHFSVKEKDKGLDAHLTLDSLFYPDYGLRLAPDTMNFEKPEWIKEGDWPKDKGRIKDWPKNGIKRNASVAITLQLMRAHVSRVLSEKYDPLCSLVLHGPAGTGKTTLVEALAVTCDVPLVEVTPSDLVRRGEENIEQRARAVFEALSMLTRAVILFDEFDPVLKRRDAANNNTLSGLSFLTPGMLPKLKDLHSGAKKRSVAYVLITNLIGGLDEAAIRQGRFDERLGIYPPDLLSRTGRFLDKTSPREVAFDDSFWRLFVDVINKTKGKGMTALGRPGWFTPPKEVKAKTPFGYVRGMERFGDLEPDDELKGIRGEGPAAVKEWLEWGWINAWDDEFSKAPTVENLRKVLGEVEVLSKDET